MAQIHGPLGVRMAKRERAARSDASPPFSFKFESFFLEIALSAP